MNLNCRFPLGLDPGDMTNAITALDRGRVARTQRVGVRCDKTCRKPKNVTQDGRGLIALGI
jgi:hypothetical protein